MHLLAFDGVDRQHNQAVVQQQQVAGFHIAGQLFVVQSHALQITQFGAGSVKHKLGATHQHDFAVSEFAHANFGPL